MHSLWRERFGPTVKNVGAHFWGAEDEHIYERPVKTASLWTDVRIRELSNTKQEFETQFFCAVCAAHLKLILIKLGKNVHNAIISCARGRIVLERSLAI